MGGEHHPKKCEIGYGDKDGVGDWGSDPHGSPWCKTPYKWPWFSQRFQQFCSSTWRNINI